MVAFAQRCYARASVPQRLQFVALIGYAAIFAALLAYGRPGLGIGQGFYVPIVLLGLATGPVGGVAAGLAAAALYVGGLFIRGSMSLADLVSMRTGIHLVSYVAVGAIVGIFATRARGMLSEALHILDDLLELGRRDLDSGALDSVGFDAKVASRVAQAQPFALFVCEIGRSTKGTRDRRDDDAVLRDATRRIKAELGPDAEVGRAGPSQLAVLASVTTLAVARQTAAALERVLDEENCRATFGWAFYPAEGVDGFSLSRAASERLYARRIVRGEWIPTPASAELVDEFSPLPRPALE